MDMSRPIIIGAGHNGLTTAFYLAKAGLKPLVLERRSIVGGGAITEELAPGYRCPTLSHVTGPLRASVVRDLGLTRRGVEIVAQDPRLVALGPDGRVLMLSTDPVRTAAAIRAFSSKDAERYPDVCATLARIAGFLSRILDAPPPVLTGTAPGDLWDLLKIGRRFRALDRQDRFRLLRWAPMAVGDLVAEWCDTDLLQAAIAARGIFGTAQGPWSAGTGAVLLLNAAVDPVPGGSAVTVRGGPGTLTRAMADAAREAGADVRLNAEVARILVSDGRAAGVALSDGTEIRGTTVVSNADPRRTLLDLVDPVDLDPSFLTKIRNYRSRGTVAKVNLALSGLPHFAGANQADLRGRIHIGPSVDYLERAFDASKYGEISQEPYLEAVIPTLQDPSLAPPGRHVMSVHVQFAPYALAKDHDWTTDRHVLARNTLGTLEHYAPGISSLVEHRQIISPLDIERTYGLTGGHIFHGELSLDQLFTMRPVLGWARYRTPIAGLYLCGAGTHPGGGLTAGSGQNAAREILRELRNGGRRGNRLG
jgi:phytoene dehydrogenase-like protein